VNAYNASLTRSTPTALSVARRSSSATTVGNYALIAGGVLSNGRSAAVDAYDTSLTRSIPTALSVARIFSTATTVGNYALIAGGYTVASVDEESNLDISGLSAVVDAYDTSLTRSTPTPLSAARQDSVATTVGNYALIAGGYTDLLSNDVCSSVVDAYMAA
jgi:hydrogenase maturation factor